MIEDLGSRNGTWVNGVRVERQRLEAGDTIRRASRRARKPALVPADMQTEGYRIFPVNPGEDELLGEPCVATLEDLSEPIDIVNVFRLAPEVPAIARSAVELGARCLWIQNGIVSDEAARIAAEAGLTVAMDCCIGIVHGQVGLGIGVTAWKAAREAAWR